MKSLLIVFVFLSTFLLSCRKDNNNSNSTKMNYVISVNQSFQIDLKSCPSTGYEWVWTNKQFVSIVDTINCSIIPNPKVFLEAVKQSYGILKA